MAPNPSPAPAQPPGRIRLDDLGNEPLRLLSQIEDGLAACAPAPAPLRAQSEMRRALRRAHTHQVAAAVHAQLAQMQADWARANRVPRLVVQARVLLQLLAELGDFPAGANPDQLAAHAPEDDLGPAQGGVQ